MEASAVRLKHRASKHRKHNGSVRGDVDEGEAHGGDWEVLNVNDEFMSMEGPLPPPEDSVRYLLNLDTDDPGPPKAADKVKSKLIKFAHKVQYGWRPSIESNFYRKKPIFLLGKCYDCRHAYEEGGNAALAETVQSFKNDFTSRIWITYREGFEKISGSRLTSDSGWGCMVRASQMILAQAMLLHFLQRDWTIFQQQSDLSSLMHKEIIRWFGDSPVQTSPFSLHRLVAISKCTNRKPGDWYGASCAANLLSKASQVAADSVPFLKEVCVYTGADGAIYKQDIIDLATGDGGDESEWKSVVIFVPLVFSGVDSDVIPSSVVPCIKALFALEDFLGAIGGTGNRAMYFVGFQGGNVIYLDPHYIQSTVDISQPDFLVQSYHCVFPRKLSFTKVQNNCTLGFYCKTRQDLENFKQKVTPLLFPADGEHSHPIFEIHDGSRTDVLAGVGDITLESV